MQILIRNNAELPKKYLRFIKWKINSINKKNHQLIYVEIHLNSEGQSPKIYSANIRLAIPGNDIILKNQSEDLIELFQKSSKSIARYLKKNKSKKVEKYK